jgi:hypothetical protein
VFKRCIKLRLYVNMYVGSRSVVVSFNVSCMVVSTARRMFCSPEGVLEIFMFLSILYISFSTISLGFSGSSLFGGTYDPYTCIIAIYREFWMFVYVVCWAWQWF